MQAYHKLVTRLVLDGRLVEVGDPDADAQRYALAPALHADTALTLDDIDQIAFELKPTEAIAALIDAREYVGANRNTVLRQAAMALQKVPPRDLVRDMILSKVDLYNAHVDEWHEHGGDDERHRRLLKAARSRPGDHLLPVVRAERGRRPRARRPAASPTAARVPSPSPDDRAGSTRSSPCACSATR